LLKLGLRIARICTELEGFASSSFAFDSLGTVTLMSDKPVYMTSEAYEQLKQELDTLQRVTRVEVAARIAQAKELGDLSENAEYHAARNEQSFVVGRIRELEHMLHRAQLIPPEGTNSNDVVRIGSMVTVREEDGEEVTYRIVGSVEANPREGKISNESPIGAALLGKKARDKVTAQTPAGTLTMKILKIA
jgi:transcription elongation factor GreA